ncbi:hypothetical protein C0J52_27386 [Blattella germanica]|nr:hypothetical protein C0J52_27386 [Blattella germanica]
MAKCDLDWTQCTATGFVTCYSRQQSGAESGDDFSIRQSCHHVKKKHVRTWYLSHFSQHSFAHAFVGNPVIANIIGIMGACRRHELHQLKVNNVKDIGKTLFPPTFKSRMLFIQEDRVLCPVMRKCRIVIIDAFTPPKHVFVYVERTNFISKSHVGKNITSLNREYDIFGRDFVNTWKPQAGSRYHFLWSKDNRVTGITPETNELLTGYTAKQERKQKEKQTGDDERLATHKHERVYSHKKSINREANENLHVIQEAELKKINTFRGGATNESQCSAVTMVTWHYNDTTIINKEDINGDRIKSLCTLYSLFCLRTKSFITDSHN